MAHTLVHRPPPLRALFILFWCGCLAAGQALYTRHLGSLRRIRLALPPRRGRRDGGRRRGRVHLFFQGVRVVRLGPGPDPRDPRRPPVVHWEGDASTGSKWRVYEAWPAAKQLPRHGTNVTMMSRAAHGSFEHVAASPHGRLREARGRKGKAMSHGQAHGLCQATQWVSSLT